MQFKFPPDVISVLKNLTDAGHQAYIVGGAVRDLIQRKKVTDWDFTTDATPKEIQKLFPHSFYDNKFGTVGVPISRKAPPASGKKAKKQPEIYEITTFRTEHGYADRRRPDKVEWGKNLDEDLSRRDFTINAMALRLTLFAQGKLSEAELIDPFDGQKDLKNKIIRAVGNPNERLNEDALRMMRAIRLASQLGFTIEEKTLSAVKKNHQLLKFVSWERIRDELLKTIASDYPADGIMVMLQTKLLELILPELTATVGIKQAGHHIYDVFTHSIESLRHCPSSDPLVRLAALLHDIGKAVAFRESQGKITFYGHEVVGARQVKQIANRLSLPRDQKDRLWRLVRWHMFAYDPKMSDAAIRRFIRRVGKDQINDMMLLRVGDRKGGGSKATSWRLREFQERIGTLMYDPLDVTDLKVSGHDVMKLLKIKPGPQVGETLNALFEEILDDPQKNNRRYLLSRIKDFKIA